MKKYLILLCAGMAVPLIAIVDKTVTAMGGRLLRRWLHRPLRDRKILAKRHQCLESLLQARLFESLRGDCPDSFLAGSDQADMD